MRSAILAGVLTIATATSAGATTLSAQDQDAMCRVAIAEARGEPTLGQIGVMQVILNRVADGFGASIQEVIEQHHAFEPVMHARGWRNLPAPTPPQLQACHAMLAVLTGNPTYFQNREIVADRAKAGSVSPSLIDFGGMPKVAVIGHHTFYSSGRTAQDSPAVPKQHVGLVTWVNRPDMETIIMDYAQ